ncbi:hypothetical protein SKAU_G00030240 [Synaphobranchus kaupii]|uniref:Uncharacterized protein n=1 Tax=Synaphobranchus kaupii TaxID=118154 RepID=A0A9Q1GDG4_SYNKA|nr:hypothetical protein SKAU_G00030240 [Synaphobranchus kaupii]
MGSTSSGHQGTSCHHPQLNPPQPVFSLTLTVTQDAMKDKFPGPRSVRYEPSTLQMQQRRPLSKCWRKPKLAPPVCAIVLFGL